MQNQNKCDTQRCLALLGAALMVVGFFTGIFSAAALTGTIILKIPRLALSTHLNALLGGMWLLCVSYSLSFLNYDPAQKKRLCLLTSVPAWANWLITFVASILGVNGLTYTENSANNIIAALLQVFVVVPSLFAGVYWVRGFFYKNLQSN